MREIISTRERERGLTSVRCSDSVYHWCWRSRREAVWCCRRCTLRRSLCRTTVHQKKNESDLPSLTRRCSPCRARYNDELLTMAFSARHHAGRRRTKVSRSWTDARFQSAAGGRDGRAHFRRLRKIEGSQRDGWTVLISPHSKSKKIAKWIREWKTRKTSFSHTRGGSPLPSSHVVSTTIK